MFNLELWRKHDGISWKYWGKLPWKQSAKKHRATATRRLELLKQINEWACLNGDCPICGAVAWDDDELIHADDCKLAKELQEVTA